MYVDYKEIGKRIAKRRKELNLKQRQVNELAELSDKYLSNIETARSIPSIDVLMRICNALDVTPDYLLVGAVKTIDNNCVDKLIVDKCRDLSTEQKMFVCKFIEWYSKECESDNMHN